MGINGLNWFRCGLKFRLGYDWMCWHDATLALELSKLVAFVIFCDEFAAGFGVILVFHPYTEAKEGILRMERKDAMK